MYECTQVWKYAYGADKEKSSPLRSLSEGKKTTVLAAEAYVRKAMQSPDRLHAPFGLFELRLNLREAALELVFLPSQLCHLPHALSFAQFLECTRCYSCASRFLFPLIRNFQFFCIRLLGMQFPLRTFARSFRASSRSPCSSALSAANLIHPQERPQDHI